MIEDFEWGTGTSVMTILLDGQFYSGLQTSRSSVGRVHP